ncbi:MAG: ATP-binding protein [Bacteroidales bacterium]|nr:ATP-binding protein [Bacteroidales bacterium]
MENYFVYGKWVEGENFTDREEETKRLKMNFEAGVNTILISPRRLGKTSLVKKVASEISSPDIKVVFMDIYDCRSEYDFYNKFASAVLKASSTQIGRVLENVKKFLTRVAPKVAFVTMPGTDFTLSLGITPENYSPEEILQLPESIAKEHGYRMVVCIDEFQQIGEYADSLNIQKRLRTAWQQQRNVSYCLFGSKKHMMIEFFQSVKMPLYQFGEIMMLKRIPTDKWVPYIQQRFKAGGKNISETVVRAICQKVDDYSSYVQQLAWNVMTVTDKEATEASVAQGYQLLMDQCSALFVQQTINLTTYQINFLRALGAGIAQGFGDKKVQALYPMGTKSNIDRIQKSLIEKELIEVTPQGYAFSDVVFRQWCLTYL